MVGNDYSHGCIGSAGYQWCDSLQKCYRSWEEQCPIMTMPGPVIPQQDARYRALKQADDVHATCNKVMSVTLKAAAGGCQKAGAVLDAICGGVMLGGIAQVCGVVQAPFHQLCHTLPLGKVSAEVIGSMICNAL